MPQVHRTVHPANLLFAHLFAWRGPQCICVVIVAAIGHTFGSSSERAVLRTSDGGRHWSKVLCRDEQAGAIDVTFGPYDPRIGSW